MPKLGFRFILVGVWLGLAVPGLSAADIVCRQCAALRASEITFAPPRTFPTTATFGPGRTLALDPVESFVVRVPPVTSVLITTSHEAEFPSEAIVYRLDRSTSVLGVSAVWGSSPSEPSVLIVNTSNTVEVALLVTAWQARLVSRDDPDCFCFDLVYSRDRMKILAQWANLISLGADDPAGDGDFNDVIVNLLCIDAENQTPPTGVRRIRLF